MEKPDPNQSHLVDELLDAICFVNVSAKPVVAGLRKFAEGRPDPYADIARAYCTNIEALFSTVSLPFTIARHAVAIQRHQALLMAKRLDFALDDDHLQTPMPELEHRAADVALQQLVTEFRSPEGKRRVIAETRVFLSQLLKDEQPQSAAQELLRQGIVLCWSAFEVAARDTFVAFLNAQPRAAERLLREPTAKRRFDASRIPLETLVAFDFDLSKNMGTLLSSYQDLSDLNSIKAALSALLESPEMKSALADEQLRNLNQKRNLIVHRRGVVDAEFMRNSNTLQGLGERLQITPAELQGHATSAATACLAVLEAAQSKSSGDEPVNGAG